MGVSLLDRFEDDDLLKCLAGSIPFICQPIGSIISGTVLEPLGRKNSMLLVNIPHLLGWYLFYTAISLPVLFLAAILMGLGKVISVRAVYGKRI